MMPTLSPRTLRQKRDLKIGVMFAPVMGPVIGGWLTDEYSWRWVFYVSMPFSLLGILGAILFIRETPKNLERKFDWFGFTALAIALAATQFLLDRGESEGWFDSDLIITTGVIVALAFYLFGPRCDDQDPFISLGILKNRNYVLGLLFMFARRAGAVDERDHAIPQNAAAISRRRAGDDAARAGIAIRAGIGGAVERKNGPAPADRHRLRVDRLFSLVIFNVHDRCRSVGVYLRRVFQRHWYRVDIRAADGGIVLDASSGLDRLRLLACSAISGIGVSIVISVLSRTQSTSHAYLAERTILTMRL